MNQTKKQTVLGTIVEGLKDSYNAQKELDKENFQLVKELSKARHEEATKPNPDFKEFKEAKGIKEKVKTIGRQIQKGANEQTEKGREAQRDRMAKQKVELETIKKRNNNQ